MIFISINCHLLHSFIIVNHKNNDLFIGCHRYDLHKGGKTRRHLAAQLLHAATHPTQCLTMTCKGCTATVPRQDCVTKLLRVCTPLIFKTNPSHSYRLPDGLALKPFQLTFGLVGWLTSTTSPKNLQLIVSIDMCLILFINLFNSIHQCV